MDGSQDTLSLVLFSGTDDKLTAAAVLAVSAAAMEPKVDILLQHWALVAFRADRIHKDHSVAPEAGPEGAATAMRDVWPGELVEVLATDLGSVPDFTSRSISPGTPGDRTPARPPPSCSWRAWPPVSASTPNGSSGATTCRPRASRFGATRDERGSARPGGLRPDRGRDADEAPSVEERSASSGGGALHGPQLHPPGAGGQGVARGEGAGRVSRPDGTRGPLRGGRNALGEYDRPYHTVRDHDDGQGGKP